MREGASAALEELSAPRLLPWLGALALLAVPLGLAWARWGLPDFNSDHLGGDACHHVVLIQLQYEENPADWDGLLGALDGYPQTAHRIASWLGLALDKDPFKAMRATMCAAMLFLALVQFALLRTTLATGASILTLIVWQIVCSQTKTSQSTVMLFYIFSQGLGIAFMWAALVLFAWPASGRRARCGLALGGALSAALAYCCHLVPGVAILGALGLWGLLQLWRCASFENRFRLAVIVGAGLLVILGTGQLRHMAQSRHVYGEVSVRNAFLLWLWVPTLLAGAYWIWKKGQAPARMEDHWIEAILCLIAVAGALQLYCVWEWTQGKAAAYAFKKFIFILFPATTLIWALALVRWQRERVAARWVGAPNWLKTIGPVAAIALCVFLEFNFLYGNEVRLEPVTQESHPARVASALGKALTAERGHGREQTDVAYFDPCLPQASVFVNVIGLRRSFGAAYDIKTAFKDWAPGAPMPKNLPCKRLLLPGDLRAYLRERRTPPVSFERASR